MEFSLILIMEFPFDTRTRFYAGYIEVRTDKSSYEAGDRVTGKVCMRILRPIRDALYVEIEGCGKEKASWAYKTSNQTIINSDGQNIIEKK